jgi:hypothetical protein
MCTLKNINQSINQSTNQTYKEDKNKSKKPQQQQNILRKDFQLVTASFQQFLDVVCKHKMRNHLQ